MYLPTHVPGHTGNFVVITNLFLSNVEKKGLVGDCEILDSFFTVLKT